MVDQALATVGHWLVWLVAFVLGLFAVIERAMRQVLVGLHLGRQVQTVVMVLLTVGLIVLAVRVFGGVFRILLMVFLVLLLVRVVMG